MKTIIIIICILATTFGPLLLYVFNLYYEETTYNIHTLKIGKVKFSNGHKKFYILHKTRLFWIGPYIWEYYQDVYDGNFCSHVGWTWFRRMGDEFNTYKEAKETYNELIKIGSNPKITKIDLI